MRHVMMVSVDSDVVMIDYHGRLSLVMFTSTVRSHSGAVLTAFYSSKSEQEIRMIHGQSRLQCWWWHGSSRSQLNRRPASLPIVMLACLGAVDSEYTVTFGDVTGSSAYRGKT